MHRVRDLLPRCDLRVVPDPGDVWDATGLGGDEGRFGDEECTWDWASALSVVLQGELGRRVGLGGAEAGEWGEDDAVGEVEGGTESEGFEEGGGGWQRERGSRRR